MLPNTRWEVTHLATKYTLELAHQDFFKAFQPGMESKKSWILEMRGAEFQSKKR